MVFSKTNDGFVSILSFYCVDGAVYNGRIIVIDRYCGSRCSEAYDPETDRWTFIAPTLINRSRFGIGVMRDGIYAVGGFGHEKDDILKR